MRTRIKICGITRAEDAAVAVTAGADALGLIFFPQSRRVVDLAQATAVAREAPPMVDLVGVFVDPSEAEITRVLESVPLTVLQFHGSESAAECDRGGLPYIKAVRMREGIDAERLPSHIPMPARFCSIPTMPTRLGAQEFSFDWDRANLDLPVPVILAGGLDSHNVAAALDRSGAWAVDVSTGVELEPGRKCPMKMKAFCEAVSAWDAKAADRPIRGKSV